MYLFIIKATITSRIPLTNDNKIVMKLGWFRLGCILNNIMAHKSRNTRIPREMRPANVSSSNLLYNFTTIAVLLILRRRLPGKINQACPVRCDTLTRKKDDANDRIDWKLGNTANGSMISPDSLSFLYRSQDQSKQQSSNPKCDMISVLRFDESNPIFGPPIMTLDHQVCQQHRLPKRESYKHHDGSRHDGNTILRILPWFSDDDCPNNGTHTLGISFVRYKPVLMKSFAITKWRRR